MTTAFRAGCALLLGVGAARPSHAQAGFGRAADVASSYARARALLDSAIVAHGGLDSIGASRFAIRFDGADVRRNQSTSSEPPYRGRDYVGPALLGVRART